MLWTMIWFLVNSVFVISLITYMFMHRSYVEAKRMTKEAELVKRLDRRRKLVGGISILFFVAMVASFVINMRLNG